jgi:hypothetical protein
MMSFTIDTSCATRGARARTAMPCTVYGTYVPCKVAHEVGSVRVAVETGVLSYLFIGVSRHACVSVTVLVETNLRLYFPVTHAVTEPLDTRSGTPVVHRHRTLEPPSAMSTAAGR